MDMLKMAWNVVGAGRVGAGRRWAKRLPLVAAVALLLSLLLAYQAVLHDVVLDGKSRRAAVAALAQDEWRCKTLADRSSAREACLVQIKAPGRVPSLLATGR
jgi:hypothetical protein